MLRFDEAQAPQTWYSGFAPAPNFAGMVELWLWTNDLKLVFRSVEGRCHGNQFLWTTPTSNPSI